MKAFFKGEHMKKILPLDRIFEIENYISNGVDAVVMGTYFSAKAQSSIYDLEEIIETNTQIPVIGLFNRDFKASERHQFIHEVKALHEGGINQIILTDDDMIDAVCELDLDLDVIFKIEDETFHQEEIEKLKNKDIKEIWFFSTRPFEDKLSLSSENDLDLGIHFFGNRFLKTKEVGEKAPFVLQDNHGLHHYSNKIESSIHLYDKIKAAGINSLYFETFASNIDDVLFVVRSLDMIDDYEGFEKIVLETTEKEVIQGE